MLGGAGDRLYSSFFNVDKLVESLTTYPDDKHSYDSEVQHYGFDWLRTNNQ